MRLPLKGGIGWMNMVIFFPASAGLLGAVAVLAMAVPVPEVPEGLAAGAAREVSPFEGTGTARAPGAAAMVVETPIVRAFASSASRVDFSLI